jgi:hypothetical protein
MEAVKNQDPDKINLDSFFKPGALNQDEPEQKSEEKEKDEEVEGEAEDKDDSEDASEDEDADEDEGDEIDDQEPEAKAQPEEEDDDDAERRAKEAEKKRRGFQSENAKLKAKNKDLEEKLASHQQQINQILANQNHAQTQTAEAQADDLTELKKVLTGDPDDFPTNEKIIKIIDGIEKRNKQSRQRPAAAKTSWMQTQPDFAEVTEYARKNNLALDPYFSGATTDEVGAYFAVRAKIQADKMKKLEDETRKFKKLVKKKSKGRVPLTGSSGSPATKSGRSKKDSVSAFWTKFDGSW